MRERTPSSRRHAPARVLSPLAALCVLLALGACSSAPPRVYAPLRYDYLLPLRLNVADITVESRFVPAGPNDLNSLDPSPLVPTLTAMAHDRLQAVGTSGRAVFVIKDASLTRTSDGGIAGSMDVELDVYGGGGTRAGYAEAHVARTQTGNIDDLRSALYDMTKRLMDAMNVEFEYQVRRNLHDWLVTTSAVPAPVQQQALPPPGSAAAPLPAPMPVPAPAPASPAAPMMSPPPSTLAPPVPYPTPAAPAPYAPPSTYQTPSTYPMPTPYRPPSPYPTPTPYPNTYPNTYAAPGGMSSGVAPTPLVPPQQP